MNKMADVMGRVWSRTLYRAMCSCQRAKALVQEESAQGTTEYAILVGVLVVIAIIAIVAFKGNVEKLWNAIKDGINSL